MYYSVLDFSCKLLSFDQSRTNSEANMWRVFNGQTVNRRLVHIRIVHALFGWTGFGIFALGFTIKKDFCFVCGSCFFIVLSFLTHTDTGQVLSKFFNDVITLQTLLIISFSLTRKRFLLRLEWSGEFLPGMFGRRCCCSCSRPVSYKYGQGCCMNGYWMTRSWKCKFLFLHRMWVHTMNENIRNIFF